MPVLPKKNSLLPLISILYSPLLLIWLKQGSIYGNLFFLLEKTEAYSKAWTLRTFIVSYLLINRTKSKASISCPTISANKPSTNCGIHGTLDVFIWYVPGSHGASTYSVPCLQFYQVAEINIVEGTVRIFKILYIWKENICLISNSFFVVFHFREDR
jgi:hypothetical protein